MTERESPDEFFDEFIDDFFSECEEHLATVRRVLLAFDAASGHEVDAVDLQDLLRALHTLKGLSGMVGLNAAEEIAHAMEDGLRALVVARRIPSAVLDSLFAGIGLLEACVNARRARAEQPSPGPYVDQMRDIIRAINSPVEDPSTYGVAAAGTAEPPKAVRRFQFAASVALLARGIGVEVIKHRLATVGDITRTEPLVQANGSVVFEFTVVMPAGVHPPEAWIGDALTWGDEEIIVEPAMQGLVIHTGTASAAQRPIATSSNVVRVEMARLDELMRMIGELVATRARLNGVVQRVHEQLASADDEDLSDANVAIERQLRAIREGVMRVRLVSVNEVFERLRFAMRDVARETRKAIHLEFSGQDTEIDKLVIDRMLEPLLHLVRNAASHGIESQSDRIAVGKSPDGTISLRARTAGDRIVLDVEDDGAGIDIVRVSARAAAARLIDSGTTLTPDALLDVLCSSGFSTRDSADMTSGRGVGMAVVRDTIRALGGALFVDSVFGRGTCFTIELPLTLMITDALVMEVGNQSMAIPQVSLREIVPLEDGDITRVENNDVLSYRGRVIPLVHLAERFDIPVRANARRHALIVGSDTQETGLVVGAVIGLREIVVHPVTDPLVAMPGIAGASEFADGRVSLVIDAAALVRSTRDRAGRGVRTAIGAPPAAGVEVLHRISEHLWS